MAKTKKKKCGTKRPVPKQTPPQEKVQPEDKSKLVWCLEAHHSHHGLSSFLTWMTQAGKEFQYQVVRVESSTRDRPVFGAQYRTSTCLWDIFECDAKLGMGYPKYYTHLEDALLSVEAYHARKYGNVSSNRDELLAHARKANLDGMSRSVSIDPKTTASPLNGRKPRSNNKMSCVDAAVKVMEEENRTLSLKEMITLMAERGYWSSPNGKTPDRTLGADLGKALAKKGDRRFKAEGKGRFSLVK